MSRKAVKKTGICLLILLAFIVLMLYLMGHGKEKYVRLEESRRELQNPDRGYYIQVHSGEKERFKELEAEGIRLSLLSFDLHKYSRQRISEEKIADLKACLQNARAHHVSIIFRAAYGFDGSCQEPEEKELIYEHIRQIAEVLNEYANQIVCVQAGMLGPYGEWHHGAYLPDDNEEEARRNRLFVLKAWEESLNQSIAVNVRRPRFIREAEEAGILVGRLGFHNDGLLGSDSDMGTYDDPGYNREEELKWTDEWLLELPNGGEMPIVSVESEAENANREFARLHLSYLNSMYNREVIEGWKYSRLNGENARQYIENHLGYRLFVSEYRYDQIREEITLTICNSGYAPIPSNYKMTLVTDLDGQKYFRELDEKNIYQICNGEEVVLNTAAFPEAEGEIDDVKVRRLGIQIIKSGSEAAEENCVELANDDFKYEDGINYMFTFE